LAQMPLFHRAPAFVAAAIVVCAQAVSVETDATVVTGGAADAPLAASKFIAGVPVYNYDKAYTGRTRSESLFSVAEAAPEESWLVVLKPGTPREELRNMCSRTTGCTLEGEHPRLPFIAMHGTEDALAAAVEPVRHLARYIDLDMTVQVEPPAHSSRGDQQEDDVASADAFLWGLDRIGADRRATSGAGVHVFVADTGIRADHVEFGGRAIPYLDMFNETHTPTRFCNESSDAKCSGDVHSHGTHCAGTIAGENYGVAPQALVYAVKVLSDQGPGTWSGIAYAMGMVALSSQRPAVISMSLGGGGQVQSIGDAVEVLVDEGVTVVVAAGNEYTDACTRSPAYAPNAITVGSIAYGDVRSGFSNFGTCLDIWAPGSGILSSIPTSYNASANKSGTSMACPHVAGAAALLLESSPSLTPAQVNAELRQAASENYIADLSPRDENLLLYVGSDGPETPQNPRDDPWPSDAFFAACGLKDQDGPLGSYPVCRCRRRADRNENGTTCYNGNTNEPGCPIGAAMEELDASPGYGHLTLYYFLWNCTTCMCHESPPGLEVPEFPPQNPVADIMILGIVGTFAAVTVGATLYTLGQKRNSATAQLELAQAP